jgi:putative MATE family efflux protein
MKKGERQQVKENKGLMTQGVIWKQLLWFAFPLLLGNLFQQFYNTVDSIVVGNYIGANALAAVGASTPIINLLVGMFAGLGTGAGVVIARFFGARDDRGVHDGVHTTIALCIVSGIAMSLIGTGLSPQILKWMHTPPEVMEGSITYLQIYFMGVGAMMIYNMGSGILRAVGDSRTPLYFLIASSILNIVLDLVFVIRIQMGVAGVAWATLVAQVVSASLVLIRLCRSKESYRLILRDIRFHKKVLLETIRIGLPGGIQNAVVSFSNVIVQYNINSFGAAAVAGCSTYTKVDGFAVLPVMSFSMAVTTFTGQNIGAKNYERVKQGAKTCLKISAAVTLTLSAALLLFGGKLLRVFSSDEVVLRYAVDMMHYLVPGYLFLAVAQTYCGVVRGAGISLVPMLALVGNMCVLRMIWIWAAMPVFHSITVVYLGYSLTWVTSALTMVIYYHKTGWLEKYAQSHRI